LPKNRQPIAASAQAPKVLRAVGAYINYPICSLKFEFSFLNGNLVVPASHQIIFGRVVTTLREPGSTSFESAECGGS
jgi:hypothetical protein